MTAYRKPGNRKTIGTRSRMQVDRIRRAVFARDWCRCLVSGSEWDGELGPACDSSLTIQHAVGRGNGGSAMFDGAQYLRTFCLTHNVLETADADFAAACERYGWSVRRRFDLAEVIGEYPVRYPGAEWYVLDADCGKREVFDPTNRRLQLGLPA